jgi:glutamyl-tRNA reductase
MMQVASGLDSMILGEPQILGQMKTAYSESCSAGAVGSLFHRLFQHIFVVAKEIRTSTAIGACPVSVASAAAYFAKQHAEEFHKANIAIIGAGETTSLLMRYLHGQLSKPITIINRSPEKAEELLNEFGGYYQSLAALPDILNSADIIFSATGSPVPIIQQTTFANVKRTKPLMLIDIAVPRDIDQSVTAIDYVNLYCIDDLKEMITKHRQGREHAAIKAIEMIAERSKVCLAEIYSFDKVAHTIRAYRGQIEEICQAELMKAKQQLAQGRDPHKVLETFSNAFMNKLMHAPSVQLRQAGVEGRYDLLRLAKQLFAIPDPEVESV